MTIASKGARNIVVGDVHYRWRARGNDDGISLVVWPAENHGAQLYGTFDYHQTRVPHPGGGTALTRQLVITNRIVRRVIDYALQHKSYDPRADGPEVNLRALDTLVDISDAERGR